jgi:hypothetical protein
MPFVTAGGVPAAFAGVATGAGSKPAPRGGSEAPRAGVRVREDLDVPVFVVNSEGEVPGFLPIRPADGRAGSVLLWEMAGTSHGGGVLSDMEDKFARDFGIPFEGLAGNQPAPEVEPNAVDWSGVSQAAMLHLDRWIATGEEPPRVPLLETEGNPPQIARDEHGNARGGVRLPPVDVPIATVTGWGDGPHFVAIAGTNVPFSAEKLRALYPDHDTYVARVRAAAEAEVAAGTLHPSAVQRFVDEAAQAAVPPPA